MRILSIDAETNGLWGQAFAVAAILYKDGKEEKRFVARCPIGMPGDPVDPWVAENVLPQLEGLPVSHDRYETMLADFASFYLANKESADILVHMGVPVEARLFLDAHAKGMIGDWDGPYPLIDVSAFPNVGTSVDAYNLENRIALDPETFSGGTHNPLYDAAQAAACYMHVIKRHT